MPAEFLVINTGPLILLGKAQALEVVGQLPLFVCPVAVRAELEAGEAKGYTYIKPSWLRVSALTTPLSLLAKAALDEGEAEVIELALQNGYRHVCLDDLRGRRLALASGLKVVGALGLLAQAKITGVIPALRPYTDRLLGEGAWYSRALVERILAGVGE